jgi:hypothetical protein
VDYDLGHIYPNKAELAYISFNFVVKSLIQSNIFMGLYKILDKETEASVPVHSAMMSSNQWTSLVANEPVHSPLGQFIDRWMETCVLSTELAH